LGGRRGENKREEAWHEGFVIESSGVWVQGALSIAIKIPFLVTQFSAV
jgi:hypothetical protein